MIKRAKWIFVLVLAAPLLIASELPDDSIYHIGSQWHDQDNELHDIGDFAGKVQVLAFVYTYCQHSCPFIIAHYKHIEMELDEEQQSNVRYLLVSLDPERDTPQTLNQYMKDHGMANGNWNMLNGDPGDVLELSALVGVRYRPMDTESKDWAHSNMITVLDQHGRIHYQMKGLDDSIEDTVEAIREVAGG